MKRNQIILAVLFLLAIPLAAQANGATPLFFAGMLHLVFGNLVIGLLEGTILARVFGLSKRKCVGLLILANYLSAWLGGLVIAGGIANTLPMSINNAWPLLWGMVAITYVLTLFLEFPFVALAFRGDPAWVRKSIRGSLLIQTISYLILFGWYWPVSGTSLYTTTEVVELSSISLPEKVLVYFISAEDGNVYEGSLRETKWKRIHELNSSGRYDRLLVRPSTADTNFWDLVARLETDDTRRGNIRSSSNAEHITVREQFASIAARSSRDESFYNTGQVPKLGEAQSSSWKFLTRFWPEAGLYETQTNSSQRISFSLDTPFGVWRVTNATHLPSDKVLLQLGDDQICVYDPYKKQIALLTRGRGPIAVMENGSRANASTTTNHPALRTD